MEGEAALGPAGAGLGADTLGQAWPQPLLWAGAGVSMAWVKERPRDSQCSREPSPAWLPWSAPALGAELGLPPCRGTERPHSCLHPTPPLLPTEAATGSSGGHMGDHHAPPRGPTDPQTGHGMDPQRTERTGGQPGGWALIAPHWHSHTATKTVRVRLATSPRPSIDSDTSVLAQP